jgi:hypothetical protein
MAGAAPPNTFCKWFSSGSYLQYRPTLEQIFDPVNSTPMTVIDGAALANPTVIDGAAVAT